MLVNSRTRLIRPEGPKGKEYPVYLTDVRDAHPNVSFSPEQPEENLHPYGFFAVHNTEVPVDDIVSEVEPVLGEDGVWYRQYEHRPFNEDEIAQQLQAVKQEAINRVQQELAALPGRVYEFTVGEEVHSHSLSYEHRGYIIEQAQNLLLEPELDSFKLRTSDGVTVEYNAETFREFIKGYRAMITNCMVNAWEEIDLIELSDVESDIPKPFSF